MTRRTLLHVNNYHYRRGGAEAVFLDQGALLGDRGWRVVPFCMHHPDNEPSPWSRFWVDEIEMGSDYSLPEKMIRSARVVYSHQARHRLGALLAEVEPDVAHLHNVYHHISPSILSLLAANDVPTVLTTHDLKLACPSYRMLTHDGICERCRSGRIHNVVRHRCVKGSLVLSSVVFAESALHRALRSFDHVDRFVSPSRFYVDKLAEWGLDRSRFTYVPNHVDAAAFEPRFGAGEGVVYFGRLAPEKGLATLVRAAAQSGVVVRLVGAGPDEAGLRALAAELDAPVLFEGFRSAGDLHELVRVSRAAVLPSEWYENGPMSVLEAYALGKPVVGARIGGISELVREGETGFGFDSGSVDDLASVLQSVVACADHEIEEMGRAGRQWVETEFSADAHVAQLFDVYRSLGVDIP